jgi:hypothetical protein
MDPGTVVATLSAAAGAGAVAGLTDTAKAAIVDAYTACKKAIRARFGDDDDAKEKLGQLEVKPDDTALQQALVGYLQTHQAVQDPAVTQAVEALRVVLTRVEGGVSSVTTGNITDNTITADRGGIAAAVITGGECRQVLWPHRRHGCWPQEGLLVVS